MYIKFAFHSRYYISYLYFVLSQNTKKFVINGTQYFLINRFNNLKNFLEIHS